MRHAKSTTMLDHYAQTDMEELIAAQKLVLEAIFSHADRPVNKLVWIGKWIETAIEHGE